MVEMTTKQNDQNIFNIKDLMKRQQEEQFKNQKPSELQSKHKEQLMMKLKQKLRKNLKELNGSFRIY